MLSPRVAKLVRLKDNTPEACRGGYAAHGCRFFILGERPQSI